jgi:hypothetical protein
MSWGNDSYGTRSYGDSPTGTIPAQFPRLYTSEQAVLDLQLQSPWLTFYDVTLAGSTTDYFVDFGDIEADDYAGLGDVTFDSNDYTTVKIAKTAIEESIDGSLPEVTLTIADPLRVVLNWVLDNGGLTSATVKMRMLSYSDIDYPARAIERNFVVNRVISSEGPAAVTFVLKAPDFSSMKFPRIFFGRHRCHNARPPWVLAGQLSMLTPSARQPRLQRWVAYLPHGLNAVSGSIAIQERRRNGTMRLGPDSMCIRQWIGILPCSDSLISAPS